MSNSAKNSQDYKGSLGKIKLIEKSDHLSNSQYYSFIGKFMEYLHSSIPSNQTASSSSPAHIEIREEFFRGKNSKRAVIFIITNGCEWALKSAHGCTMCGHLAKQALNQKQISSEDFVTQFESAFSTIDFEDMPILNVFNNGSFFNDREMPSDARKEILRLINKNKYIEKLLVESRPEFITQQAIQELKSLIPEKELEIAVGLETTNDLYRILSVNKGYSFRTFLKSAQIIMKNNIKLRTYILLKPPFFSERLAVDDAIRSIKTVFELGADTVSLEGITVQKYTLVDYLYRKGLYRTPWLWSIIEIIEKTHHLGKVLIGLFTFYPSPDVVPSNCPSCNHEVMNAIVRYNQTLNPDIFKNLNCQCKEEWRDDLESGDNFQQNLDRFVSSARREFSDYRKSISPNP
jgi:radical SAM enzyme (TIGR01210 family)